MWCAFPRQCPWRVCKEKGTCNILLERSGQERSVTFAKRGEKVCNFEKKISEKYVNFTQKEEKVCEIVKKKK
jgi:hypothetical protein